MRKGSSICWIVFIFLFLPFVAKAEEGRTAGLTLIRAIGARPAALGEAFVAVPDDIQGLAFNPAPLAKLGDPAITASYNDGIEDDKYGSAAFGYPLSFGSVFVGASYFDAGNFELDINGVSYGSRKAQQDMVGLLGVAFGRVSPLSLGVTGKIFKSELAEVASASAFAGDVGLFYKTPLSGLTLGASLQNIGSDLKYEVKSEPLPQTVRGGFAYNIDLQQFSRTSIVPYNFLIVADGVKTKNEDAGVNTGLELRRNLIVSDQNGYASLRGGYSSLTERINIGIGFRIGNFLIDYTLGFSDEDLDNINRANIGWVFGKPSTSRFDPDGRANPTFDTPTMKRKIGGSYSR